MPAISDATTYTASDADLLDLVRAGDDEAFGILWRRHDAAGRAAARRVTRRFAADDLLQEASVRILGALHRGAGPTEAMRPYLYRTITNVAAEWARREPVTLVDIDTAVEFDLHDGTDDRLDLTLLGTAFRSLPERWKTVLWYVEVEGMGARDLAPILGVSANAVALLTMRAREGLTRAWIDSHFVAVDLPPDCSWTREHLGGYVRDGLSSRDLRKAEEHLAACGTCPTVVVEARELSGRLRGELWALGLLPGIFAEGAPVGDSLGAAATGAAGGAGGWAGTVATCLKVAAALVLVAGGVALVLHQESEAAADGSDVGPDRTTVTVTEGPTPTVEESSVVSSTTPDGADGPVDVPGVPQDADDRGTTALALDAGGSPVVLPIVSPDGGITVTKLEVGGVFVPIVQGVAAPGITVTLVGTDGVVLGSAVTDASGAFRIDVDALTRSQDVTLSRSDGLAPLSLGRLNAATRGPGLHFARTPEAAGPGATAVTFLLPGNFVAAGADVEVLVDGVPVAVTPGADPRLSVTLTAERHVVTTRNVDPSGERHGRTAIVVLLPEEVGGKATFSLWEPADGQDPDGPLIPER